MLQTIAKSLMQYRLCRRIAACVFLSIIAIEAIILVPSYYNYQSDLVRHLEQDGRSQAAILFSTRSTLRPDEFASLTQSLEKHSPIRGGILFDREGEVIGSFGDLPSAGVFTTGALTSDGDRFDVLWGTDDLAGPYKFAARLDATPIQSALTGFIWRIIGLVLLIAVVVSTITMIFIGRLILLPLIRLRDNLVAAANDPAHVDQYTLPIIRRDEMGDVANATNQMLEQVAEAHRSSLDSMTMIANRAADAIIAYGQDGKIQFANRACLEMTGCKNPEERERRGLPRFALGDEPGLYSLPETLAGDSYSRDGILLGKNGARRPVMVNAARLGLSSRSPMRFYASITDISALVDARVRLEEQNVELRAASKAKSEFLANMSHELRTPLNAIIGFSEAITTGLFGPIGNVRYRSYAEDIHNSGHHLLRIINDILDLAKVEAGRITVDETRIDVADLIEGTCRIVRERADSRSLKLRTGIDKPVPDLLGDDRLIKQMLINLLANAIKFTDPGGIVIVSATCRDGAIALTDTGDGMAPEMIATALEPFGQVDSSLSRRHDGTGLGLPLTNSFMRLHGGELAVESTLGEGSTVSLRFPAERTLTDSAEKITAA